MINHSVDLNLLKDAVSKIDNNEFKTSLNVPTGDFFYDLWTIKSEFKDTVWEDLLNSLPFDKGEARIIVLKPGTSYYCHADADDRWHLNLQSEFGFICDIDQSIMHKLLPDGNWYEMNAGRRHTAANFGSIDRIQLVVRQLLKKNKLLDPVAVKIIAKTQTVDFRYQFDNTVSLWLNDANKKSIVCDFKFIETEVSFKVEKTSLQSLIEIVPDIFEVVV